MRRRLRDNNAPPTIDWQERAQFFTLAVAAMQRFRAARAKDRRAYRSADARAVPDFMEDRDALDELVARLESLDSRQARIVAMHCFDGLTIEQTAEVLGISDATVEREWTHARAWLRRELSQR